MKISKAVITLSILSGLFGLVQSCAGLFWQVSGKPFPFTTLHGQTVQINGQGIYAFDTAFKVPIFRGTDAVTLVVALPLLVIALLLYRRGSLRGGLVLVSALAYMLYNSASVAFGVTYNNLFLVYLAYFSTSLFAFLLAFTAVDVQELSSRIGQNIPRRGIAILMFVSGLALVVAWLGDIVAALVQGRVPDIASYTTEVTYVIDLGIVAPVTVLAGIMMLRRAPIGYLLSITMGIVLAIVGVVVTSQTVFQSMAGIQVSAGQFIGKAGSFMLLAMISVWLIARLFRGMAVVSGKGVRI